MNDAIIVALIGLAGSGIGSILGVLVSSKLTIYRVEQLEKQFAKLSKISNINVCCKIDPAKIMLLL